MTAETVGGVFVGILWLMFVAMLMGGGVAMFVEPDESGIGSIGLKAFGVVTFTLGLACLVVPIAFMVLPHAEPKPCVRHETTMQYNAATKTTMPVTYCAQYGEWAESK